MRKGGWSGPLAGPAPRRPPACSQRRLWRERGPWSRRVQPPPLSNPPRRPAGGGHDQRRLRHLPVARQHLPVRRRHYRARPGPHAGALLPDADPRRAHRDPRLHIGVADLSHRRGSSQKTPFCAPRTDRTEETVPLQNESRATAAASDHHVARPTLQSVSEPSAEYELSGSSLRLPGRSCRMASSGRC